MKILFLETSSKIWVSCEFIFKVKTLEFDTPHVLGEDWMQCLENYDTSSSFTRVLISGNNSAWFIPCLVINDTWTLNSWILGPTICRVINFVILKATLKQKRLRCWLNLWLVVMWYIKELSTRDEEAVLRGSCLTSKNPTPEQGSGWLGWKSKVDPPLSDYIFLDLKGGGGWNFDKYRVSTTRWLKCHYGESRSAPVRILDDS